MCVGGCLAVTTTYSFTQSKNYTFYYQLLYDQYKIMFKLFTNIGRNALVRQNVGTTEHVFKDLSDRQCGCAEKNYKKIHEQFIFQMDLVDVHLCST